MNSFNHYSLGSVGEWLYRFVAGIDQPSDSVGFERVELRPHPDGSMAWAQAAFRSVRGEITSSWRHRAGELTLDVGVPADVTATVHLPSTDPDGASDGHGGGPSSVREFCGARGMGEAVFPAAPGSHRFVAPYRVPPV